MSSGETQENTAIRQQRLERLLEVLADRGISQTQVAQRVAVPAGYLSDVKRGARPMSELFARRLAEEFRFDFHWLLGEVGTLDSLELGREVVEEESDSIWLPVFLHPIQGHPRSQPDWDGSSVQVCGAAAARARGATEPYVLRFQRDEHTGKLMSDDLVLISQAVNDDAEIQVIKVRRGMYLARRLPDGSWERLAEKGSLPGDIPALGHALGIVWRSL
jgi:transcriptional regulator with XRE-family HTH domain